MKKLIFLIRNKSLIQLSSWTFAANWLVTSSSLFVCPACGKESLTIHRRTYEKLISVFCDDCHLIFSFEPSDEAYFDPLKSLEEFKAKFKEAAKPVLSSSI